MSVLDKIVAVKQTEIARARELRPESAVRDAALAMPPARPFFHVLAQPGPIKLIAEVKKASPSAGLIRAACPACATTAVMRKMNSLALAANAIRALSTP